MKFFFVILITLLFIFPSCQKEGTGGKAMLHGSVSYNGILVADANVFIWYGKTSVSDYNNGFNDQQRTNTKGEFEFHDLRKGDYYLYATVSDTTGIARTAGTASRIKSKSDVVFVKIEVK